MEKSREEINEIFNHACENGELSTIRNLVKTYPGYVNLENNDGYGFKKACEKSHINVIDYLINTQEVVKNINLDYQENIGFYIACEYEQIEVLKYYFNNQQYQLKNGLINTVFIKSCEKSNVEMYMVLKSFDLVRKIDPEWNKYKGFKLACKNEISLVINDMIFYKNIELKDILKQWLIEENYIRVLNTFKKRQLYNSLK